MSTITIIGLIVFGVFPWALGIHVLASWGTDLLFRPLEDGVNRARMAIEDHIAALKEERDEPE